MAKKCQFLTTTCRGHCCFAKDLPLLIRAFSFKLHDPLRFRPSTLRMFVSTCTMPRSIPSDNFSITSESPNVGWDNPGFDPEPTGYMFVMKCTGGDEFSDGELQRFGKIELNPFSSVLNYGQGIFEGLKAYKREDNSILLFRPEKNAMRMRVGADRFCMPAPTIDQFVEAVKLTVSANRRWGGLKPINLVVDTEFYRAFPGGVGSIKAIGNYASIMKTLNAAKANGFDEVLYLDSVHNRYLEEVSIANIFIVKGKTICTPALRGTILPGVTRESIIDIARIVGFQVEERLVSVEELFVADEVFCTANAVGLWPVGSITHQGKRVGYGGGGLGAVSQQLYSALSNIQMGLTEDKMGWTVLLE